MEQVHALRRWRTAHKITLAALADRVGVEPSHLSEIERGKNRPSLQLAAKLSKATAPESNPEAPEVSLSEFVRAE